MSEANHQGDVRAAIEAVERLATPKVVEIAGIGDGEIAVIPKGMVVVDFKPHLDARRASPERMKGTAKMTTLAAFIAFVRRFADEDSAIFAVDSRQSPKLVAVFDYNEAHVRNDDGAVEVPGAPRFGEHRAEYAFPLSDAWKAWNGVAGKTLSQADFAAFLEERIGDVVAPEAVGEKTVEIARTLRIGLAGADDLMALARGLAVHVDTKVKTAVNLSTGEATIGFEETHRDAGGGQVRVPGGFALSIPVFRGGAPYAIVARLRYRVREGSVTWTIQLQRVEESFDHAFAEACDEARVGTACPVFFGSPEA